MKPSINKGYFLLRKWIDGSITAAEERELEQLAKGDPMLADALEGLRQQPDFDHLNKVNNIKARLQQRTQQKRRGLIFFLPRIAAAAAVVAALTLGLQYFFNTEKIQPEVANKAQQEADNQQNETPIAALDEGRGTRDEGRGTREEEGGTRDERQVTSSKPQEALDTEKESIVAEESASSPRNLPSTFNKIELPPAEVNKEKAKKIAEAEVPALDTEGILADGRVISVDTALAIPGDPLRDKAARMTVAPKPNIQKFNSIPPNQRIIAGRVTDNSGAALIGASIIIKGTNTGTVSDIDGNFSIKIPEGKHELIVNYTGFKSEEISVESGDTIAIRLDENGQALSEVVVTGYGRKLDRSAEESIPIYPEPRDGYKRLERYIRNNLQYPEAAKANAIEGNVVLTFQVQPDGTPTDFKVIQSLGYGCDEEAMRLLREGPKWRYFDPTHNTANYTVSFRLKK